MTEATDLKPTYSTKVVGPFEAECPEDGGKWAIYCEHYAQDGELTYSSILQDTNKTRLRSWKKHPGDWCGLCQEEAEGGSNWTFHHPYSNHSEDPTRKKNTMTTAPAPEADPVEQYLEGVLASKPYVVAVKHKNRTKPKYLHAERRRRIVTTDQISAARGFKTQAEAILWITQNEPNYCLLSFWVSNRHEIESARIAALRARTNQPA